MAGGWRVLRDCRHNRAVSKVHEAIAAYYSATLAAHGATARGADWKDDASHRVRHDQFLRLLGDDRDASIADLGCGFGSFLSFLRGRGYRGRYTGYDVAPAMVAAAERLHGLGADRVWRVAALPDEEADYVIASGIFNVRQQCAEEDWREHVETTISGMAAAARRGWGFNVLSLHSDAGRRRSDLYYADPVKTVEQVAARYGRSLALLQDYGLYEFTLLVRRAS